MRDEVTTQEVSLSSSFPEAAPRPRNRQVLTGIGAMLRTLTPSLSQWERGAEPCAKFRTSATIEFASRIYDVEQRCGLVVEQAAILFCSVNKKTPAGQRPVCVRGS